ncbi:MAG: hypothetical protein V4664_02320 [Patescibacteria group bacterium]
MNILTSRFSSKRLITSGVLCALFVLLSLIPSLSRADIIKLSTPKFTSAENIYCGAVKLTWTKSLVGGIVVVPTRYSLYRLNPSTMNLDRIVSTTSTSYIDSTGPLGTYSYIIQSENIYGISLKSAPLVGNNNTNCTPKLTVTCSLSKVTTPNSTAKDYLWTASTTGGTSNRSFKWNDSSTNFSSSTGMSPYLYKRYSMPGLVFMQVTVTSGVQKVTASCLGTIAQAPLNGPAVVTRTATTTTCGSDISFSWAPVTKATGYSVYRSTGPASDMATWTKIATNIGQTQFTDPFSSVKASTTYFYRVTSLIGDIEPTGLSSNVIPFVSPYYQLKVKTDDACGTLPPGPVASTTLPAAPLTFTAKEGATCQDPAILKWSPVIGSKGYKVKAATSLVGPFIQIDSFATTSSSTTITYMDKTASPGSIIYKVSAYNDFGTSLETVSNIIIQPDCYDPDGKLDYHDPDADDTEVTPNYSLFTVKSFGSPEFAAEHGDDIYVIPQPTFLVYSINPSDPENWIRVQTCANFFCDTDSLYGGVVYFPKIAPGSSDLFDTIVMEVRTDQGVKKILGYVPKNIPDEEFIFPGGIRNVSLDLPLRYKTQIPSYYEQSLTMGVDDAYRFLRISGATLNGHLDIYAQAYHTFTTEELKSIPPNTPYPSKEIKTATVDFTDATSPNWWSGTTFSNYSSGTGYGESNGVRVTRYLCDGQSTLQNYFQLGFNWFGDTIDNGDDTISTGVQASTYGSNLNRGNCDQTKEYYNSNSSTGFYGSPGKTQFKNPIKFYTVEVVDYDGALIKSVDMWGESDPNTIGGNYRVSGAVTIRLSKFDSYDGMFNEEGLLSANPDYTESVDENRYPLLASLSLKEKIFARLDMLIRYNPLSASVTAAFSKVQQVFSGINKNNQTATVYRKLKKKSDSSRIARNGKGNTPKKASGTAPVKEIDLTKEYATRDRIAYWFAHAGQVGPAINRADAANLGVCTTNVSKNCTAVLGLSDEFILQLAQIRQIRKNAEPGAPETSIDLIISGGTEFWLHGNRSNDRASNGTSHGYSMTVDISKRNGYGTWILKTFNPFPGCSKWLDLGNNLRFLNEDSVHFHVEGYPVKDTCGFNRANFEYSNY